MNSNGWWTKAAVFLTLLSMLGGAIAAFLTQMRDCERLWNKYEWYQNDNQQLRRRLEQAEETIRRYEHYWPR